MATIISVLIIIICFVLALIILIQNPKGGGLDSTFGSANQLGGVKKTTDFLDKATWTLAIAVVVLSLVSASFNGSTSAGAIDDEYRDEAPVAAPQQAAPQQAAPAAQPETQNEEAQ